MVLGITKNHNKKSITFRKKHHKKIILKQADTFPTLLYYSKIFRNIFCSFIEPLYII